MQNDAPAESAVTPPLESEPTGILTESSSPQNIDSTASVQETVHDIEEKQTTPASEAPAVPAADVKPTESTDSKPTSETADEKQPSSATPATEQPPQEIKAGTPKPDTPSGKHGKMFPSEFPKKKSKKNKKDEKPLRKAEPVQTVKPSDIKKPQVSFLNSIANLEPASRARWTGATTQQAYDHAVKSDSSAAETDYQPKIRRMSDSTRAKELRRQTKPTPTPYASYGKDSPDRPHEPPKAPPKRRRHMTLDEQLQRIPDELMEQPYEELTDPIKLIEKAKLTQISIGEESKDNVDIDVRYHDERRKRFDLPKEAKDFKHPEDKISIRHDILELKNTLSLRVVLVGLVTACSCLLSLMDWIPGFPTPRFLSSSRSPISFLIVQILLGILAIPVSGDLLKNGFSKLIHRKADCDSIAALSIVSAEIASVVMLFCPKMLSDGFCSVYIGAALFAVWVNAISKKMIVTRAQRNFEVLANDQPKYAIHYVEDETRAENLTKGTLGDLPILATMQPTEKVTDFLRYTFSADLGDQFCKIAVPLVVGLSLLLSVFLSVIRHDVIAHPFCYGLSVFALCLCAGSCAGIPLVSNLPLASATKRYVRGSGLLLGYQSVDDFYDVNTVMVDVSTLFPQGTTKLESIQITGESPIEEALQYAASLTQYAGSILKDIFSNAILTEEHMILPVENYAYNEGSGISGWIRNKRVLLGKREMMIEHSIEGLPAVHKEEELTAGGNEAIYLSVSGTVAAMFIVSLSAGKSVKKWLRELESEGIHLLVRSNDALLSQRRLSRMFGFPEDLLKIIPTRLEQEYLAETQPLQTASASMICEGRLPGFVQTIVGAKRIRSAAMLGSIMQAVSASLGIVYIVIFLLLHAYNYLVGGILLTYQILWTLLTIAVMKMKEF